VSNHRDYYLASFSDLIMSTAFAAVIKIQIERTPPDRARMRHPRTCVQLPTFPELVTWIEDDREMDLAWTFTGDPTITWDICHT
jgi:hypothetical protein